jgi:hypothetical protein
MMDIKKVASETRNPRRSLLPGQTPKQRAMEKLIMVLVWMYEWRTTISPLVTALLGTTETTYLRELEKKGYVTSFRAPRLLCGRAYMLTRDGVNAAASALGKELRYSVHPSSVSHVNLKHDLAVQRYAINALVKGYKVIPCRDSASINKKIPDAFVEVKNGRFAVEIELEGKWGDELEQTLNSHLKAILSGDWAGVFYVSNSNTLLKRYEERLKSPIPDWWQTTSSIPKLWIRGDAQTLEEHMRARFLWAYVPNLLKDFEQIK